MHPSALLLDWFGNEEESRETLLERLQLIQYVLEQSVVLSITDHKGMIQYANEKFCRLSQYTLSELVGQPYSIVNSQQHPPTFFRDLWQTITAGNVWEGEICNRAKDGTLFWLMTFIVPILDAQQKPRHYLAIRMDITKRKQAEAKIQELTGQLEEQVAQRTAHLDALNEEFSSTIQHYAKLFLALKQTITQMNSLVQLDMQATEDADNTLVHEQQRQVFCNLSHRERDVLALLVEGKTNREIAELLSISTHTAKSHVSIIMQKFNVSDRTKVAIIGVKLGHADGTLF